MAGCNGCRPLDRTEQPEAGTALSAAQAHVACYAMTVVAALAPILTALIWWGFFSEGDA
jgi:hypothetical protein